MDTDVLIVGAGPTGPDARQSTRAARRARHDHRPALRDRPSSRGRWPCRRARSRSTRRWASSTRRSRSAAKAPAPTCGRTGKLDGAHPARGHRQEPEPVSVRPDAGPGRQRAHHGREACAITASTCSGTPSWSRFEQQPDHVDATLKQPDGSTRKLTAAWVAGCDGGRSAVRELSGITFPGRAVRAHVLRRRYRGHRADGARRAQRLSVAGRVPPVLPDAGQGSLARDRHPARRRCAHETISTFEDLISDDPPRGGRRAVLQGVQLVLDLSHPSPLRRALPRPALLPARRRGARPQPDGRAGHEHRLAGRLQPGVEARARRQRAGRRGAARHLRAGAHAGRAAAAAVRPIASSRCWCPTAGSRGCSARASSRRVVARAMTVERVRDVGVPHASRRSASAIERARCRRCWRACPRAHRQRATASRGCTSGCEPNGPVEDLFQKLDDTRFNLLVIGQPAPAAAGLGSVI